MKNSGGLLRSTLSIGFKARGLGFIDIESGRWSRALGVESQDLLGALNPKLSSRTPNSKILSRR